MRYQDKQSLSFSESSVETEKLARLRLIRSPQVGPITYRQLMERFKSATCALEALPDLARRGGAGKAFKPYSRARAEKELEACAAQNVLVIMESEAYYPPRLRHIDDAPPFLFVRGDPVLLGKKAVAVIGARNCSTNGRRMAERIAADLGHSGLLVVSGMARGIDAAAHQGALDTGTVAVLGGGVDIIYPRENAAIYKEIVQRGVIISEMPLGTQPKAAHFPRRNRIISGISRGIVVVEAAPRSGSLITARLALEQGREVFAVPGAAGDPRARGANDLIRQGAILTETAADVIDVLRPDPRLPSRPLGLASPTAAGSTGAAPSPHKTGKETAREKRSATRPKIEPDETATVDGKDITDIRRWLERRLGPTPVDVDDLARELGAPMPHLTEALVELELAGRVERQPGNLISALINV